ncbi:MAG: FAD-dependent oxidoreductase, partial [Pseudomonadota bacterium]
PIPGLADLWGKGAYPLKNLEHGRNLKRALAKKPRSAVIIGGGYIGLEVTEGLHQQGLDITIVEAAPHILPFLPESLRERAIAEAKAQGVTFHIGVRANRIEKATSEKFVLQTDVGELRTDLVIVATGVQPNSELAANANLKLAVAKSIAVDEFLFTSNPDILAAGDCADAIHGITGQSTWIPLALRANRAGKLAGANALGKKNRIPPVMGTAVFKFFNLQIARTGLSETEAALAGFETTSALIQSSTRAHYYPGGGKLLVWLLADKKTRKLLGGAMVGPEGAAHRIDTIVAALHAGLTVEQLYNMDLAYAPPFGPSWSPLLTCASQLAKTFP